MGDFIRTTGATITQFVKGLSAVWEWMTSPITIGRWTLSIGNWQIVPIEILGAGFVIVLGIVFALHIKELII